MSPARILVHYGEIGTKGANRHVFEGSLEENIRNSLTGLSGLKVKRIRQRIFVSVDSANAAEARRRLGKVFGVVWFAQVESTPPTYPAILETALRVLADCDRGSSFRVSARRSDKSSDLGSQELARKLGEDIIEKLGLKVNLSRPDTTLFVDVVWGEVLVYRERIKGLAGLPTGVSGRVLHLLSGGIDSPVAAWLMMKRGCSPTYLHFYLAPTVRTVLESKVVELVRLLDAYAGGDGRSELILVPFAPYQLATAALPPEYEPIVFRRFVRMVAEVVASRLGCLAVSTGDNLAQVASQTLQNLRAIDSGSMLPTLRPVLTYDKEEIVQLAKVIGTYEVSLRPYQDCCSIVSRHPRTRMKVDEVDQACSYFKLEELARDCVAKAEVAVVTPETLQVRPLSELIAPASNDQPRSIVNQ